MPRRTAASKMDASSALQVLYMFMSVFLFFLRSLLLRVKKRRGKSRGKGNGPGGGPGSCGAGGGGGGGPPGSDLAAVLSTLSGFGLVSFDKS